MQLHFGFRLEVICQHGIEIINVIRKM